MKFLFIVVATILPSAAFAQSTIAGFLSNPPAGKSYQLTRAAAVAAANPEWGTAGAKTLFVPVDSSNPPSDNRAGTLFLNDRSIDFRNTVYYQILFDAGNKAGVVYDNYDKENPQPIEIRLRSGTDESRVLDYYAASNGYVYVIDKPIPDLAPVTDVLAANGYTAMISALSTANVADRFNALTGATILVPSNAAITSISQQIAALTTDQLTAVLQNHILSAQPYYSTQVPASAVTSLLGQSLNFEAGQESNGEWAITIGAGKFLIPSDTLCASGVIQLIDTVLLPSSISPPVAWPASTTTTPTSNTTGTSPSSTPTPSNGSNSVKCLVSVLSVALLVGFF